MSSEEYYYAYLLNGKMTEEELKNFLEDIEFDVDDVDDEYFKEYWKRMTKKKDDILEGIDELKDWREGACWTEPRKWPIMTARANSMTGWRSLRRPRFRILRRASRNLIMAQQSSKKA